MKININYLDNQININKEEINVLEIHNKSYLQRIIRDFNDISNSLLNENIYFNNHQDEEVDLNGKIFLLFDYFNFQTKTYNLYLQKLIVKNLSEENQINIENSYKKIYKEIKKSTNELEIDISIEPNFSIDIIMKLIKLNLFQEETILKNIYNLIELESILKINKLLIFVDLKKYLNNKEIEEVYKYSIYKEVNILLIESVNSKEKIKFEKVLKIDDNLEEYML